MNINVNIYIPKKKKIKSQERIKNKFFLFNQHLPGKEKKTHRHIEILQTYATIHLRCLY